jgi:gamma-glutamyltranspeptidase/glutathione hydrolase
MKLARREFIMAAMGSPPAFSQDRWQARSMVITQRGIVATSQTLASMAGAQVLARGGSAMDAAIAANATLSVVEPMMNGIGGDLFAIYRDAKTGRLSGMNASGPAPKGLTTELLRQRGRFSMPQEGILSVSVPGCVDGWQKLHAKFGKLAWADLFRPSIHYARQGFPVTELIQSTWSASISKLQGDDNARRVFLLDGRAPEVGQVFRNPALAKALELIAREGASAFYRGPIARAILSTSKRLDGVVSADDLSGFEAEWVEPVSTTYRGWKVFELPPNGQGMAVLSMLNMMERFPLANLPPFSAEAFHIKLEAQKLAYADLQRYLGDPRFGAVPLAGLISKDYAAKRAELIQMDTAGCSRTAGMSIPSTGDTVYLCAVDAAGNIASLIQSIYLSFGSGVAVDDFGFHLHNRAALFVLDEGHPNELKPGKRPFHTIIPGYMEKDNLHAAFGIMGGLNQAQAHAQWISYLVDHDMNMQGALEAARFTKLTFGGCDAMIESRVPQRTLDELRKKGHSLQVQGEFSSWMGGGQAVMHDSTAKVNYGASSPRKDGAAVPEPDAYFESAPPKRR